MSEELVFDTGPLSHIAQQGWLGALRFVVVVGERVAVMPDTVVAELQRGLPNHPHLQQVLDAPWIQRRELVSAAGIAAFANFSALLVANDRNIGEAGVLRTPRSAAAWRSWMMAPLERRPRIVR